MSDSLTTEQKKFFNKLSSKHGIYGLAAAGKATKRLPSGSYQINRRQAEATAKAAIEKQRQAEEEARRKAELKKQQEEARKLQEQLRREREQKAYEGTTVGQIEVGTARSSSGQLGEVGKVKVGGSYYVGSAVVPDTGGLTADQYRREIEQQAVSEGIVGKSDLRRSVFTLSPAVEQTTTEESKVIGGADMFKSSLIDTSGIPKTNGKDKEVYSSLMGGYLTSTLGGSGTSLFRSPTQEEQVKIDILKARDEKIERVITKDIPSAIWGGQPTPEQQAFGFKSERTLIGGTEVTPILRPYSETKIEGVGILGGKKYEMTEPALVLRRSSYDELGSGLKFETKMKKERDRILGIISPDGITQEEADWANVQLKSYYDENILGYEKAREESYSNIVDQAFKERRPIEWKTKDWLGTKTQDWKITKWAEGYDPLGTKEKYGEGVALLGSFGSGLYKGVREQPLTMAKTVGIAVGVSVITGGLGAKASAVYGAAKVTAVSKKIATGTKLLYAGYGVSIGARVLGAGDKYAGAETLGRITSTEIAPFIIGARVGKKIVGGYRPFTKKDIPQEFAQEVKAYEKAFKIMKKSPIEVKNIRWGRVQEVPTKAGKIIEQFMKKHKLILGGTTAIETGGINLRRLPRDVEAYGSFNKISKMKLYRDLGKQLKGAGITDFKISTKGIIFGGEGHGFNLQDISALNIQRYRYKIWTTPSGVRVADPLSTAYNKVADLLKSAPLGTPQAKKVALKLEKTELITKATAGGRIFERYPKDVIGALSTARDITQKSLIRYGDFSRRQIPLLQEYRMLRFGQAKELIKPYLSKLKFEEAPAIPYYYTGKTAGILSGVKYVDSYTLFKLKHVSTPNLRIGIDKKARVGISSYTKEVPSSYYWLPKTPAEKYPLIFAPIIPSYKSYAPIKTDIYRPFIPYRTTTPVFRTTLSLTYRPIFTSKTFTSPYYPTTTYPSIPTLTIPPIIPPITPKEKKTTTGKLYPRLPKIFEQSIRPPQRKPQPTRYQVSLTGAFVGARLQVPESLAGGLGVRGYRNNKKQKQIRIL